MSGRVLALPLNYGWYSSAVRLVSNKSNVVDLGQIPNAVSWDDTSGNPVAYLLHVDAVFLSVAFNGQPLGRIQYKTIFFYYF